MGKECDFRCGKHYNIAGNKGLHQTLSKPTPARPVLC